MKSKVLTVLLACATAIIGGVLGYIRGRNDIQLENYKTYVLNVSSYYEAHSNVDFGDYLKARYYYFANRIPQRFLTIPAYDYGPVDFKGFSIGKGPTTPKCEYEHFKERKVSHKPFDYRTKSDKATATNQIKE
jgi:hypothetical protein